VVDTSDGAIVDDTTGYCTTGVFVAMMVCLLHTAMLLLENIFVVVALIFHCFCLR
jgi:hypothetical protein